MTEDHATHRAIPWASVVAHAQAVTIVGFVVLNVLNAFVIWRERWDHNGYLWLLLNSESNPGTWFASTLLLGAGACALLCAGFDRRDHQRVVEALDQPRHGRKECGQHDA